MRGRNNSLGIDDRSGNQKAIGHIPQSGFRMMEGIYDQLQKIKKRDRCEAADMASIDFLSKTWEVRTIREACGIR